MNISITKALKNSFSRPPAAFLSDQGVEKNEIVREEEEVMLVVLIL